MILYFLLGLLFLLCLYFIIGSYMSYRMTFFCNKKKQKDVYDIPTDGQMGEIRDYALKLIKDLDAKNYEKVSIQSFDKLKLFGRFYDENHSLQEENKNVSEKITVIDLCFHGWRGNPITDFCGGTRISFDLGHKVLLVEERAQWVSEGKGMTFGIKEKQDVLSWIDYIIARFGNDVQINLIGVSMGAATVLMASALDLPENVRHIVADAPYSSPVEIIRKVCSVDMKLPYKLLWPIVYGGAFLFAGFKLNDKSGNNLECVKKSKVPILIIHGEEDLFVPCEMSKRIAAENPKIKRETFPGAGHCLSYMKDTPRYEKLVKEFLEDKIELTL
ncbi:MAG: alpha/beta hydrolase [Treponema sp.]|nr:alpha/beta hydrolase [Treponema sp.]